MKRISFSTPNELSNFVEDSGHTLILFGRGWESTFIEVQNSLSIIKNEDIFPVNFCFASVIEYPTFFDESLNYSLHVASWSWDKPAPARPSSFK